MGIHEMTGGKPRTNQYLERLRPTLDATGIPWRIENGTRHTKVFVGEVMATVIPRGSFSDGNMGLLRKTIRNINAAADLARMK